MGIKSDEVELYPRVQIEKIRYLYVFDQVFFHHQKIEKGRTMIAFSISFSPFGGEMCDMHTHTKVNYGNNAILYGATTNTTTYLIMS